MKKSEYEPKRAGKRLASDDSAGSGRSSDSSPRRRSRGGYGDETEPAETQNASDGSAESGRVIPGVIISAVLLVLVLVFDVYLTLSQLFPLRILLPVYIVLFLLILLVAVLVSDSARRARFRSGLIIGIVTAAALVFGLYMLYVTTHTIKEVTQTETQVTHVGLYVLREDPAETLNDLAGYEIGILEEQDRVNTDQALEQLEEQIESAVSTTEYGGLEDLAEGLYSRECGAVALNSGYLDVIVELEGYEDFDDRIREVDTIRVEQKVEVAADEPEETGETEEAERTETIPVTSDVSFLVYVAGVDSRTGLVAKSRDDVNILAAVNTASHQILLINTPRDYYVPLSISNGQPDKLTHAGIYGIDVAVDTISMLYDTPVDYYFRVDFSGFKKIINALGGITVNSEVAFTTGSGVSNVEEKYSFVVGANDMDGDKALAFSRERYSLSGGDNQRGRNQMAVIEGVIDKIMSPEILLNYSSVMNSISDSFETSMSYDLIAAIVNDQLADGGGWNVVSYSVTGTGANRSTYSQGSGTYYVMIPDESSVQTAKDLIAQVRAGEVIVPPDD